MTPMRALSTAFGLLMVAVVALRVDAPGLVVASASAVAVLMSALFRWAATAAVLGCAVCLTLSDAGPSTCAGAGVAATCFVILCHDSTARPFTWPTVIAIVTASCAGLLAAAVPGDLPWAPLAGPPAVLLLFVVVVEPLRRRMIEPREDADRR